MDIHGGYSTTHTAPVQEAEEALLTRREVAALLRATPRFVSLLVARGRLCRVEVDGIHRFRRVDVERLLEPAIKPLETERPAATPSAQRQGVTSPDAPV